MENTTDNSSNADLKKLGELIEGIEMAMLTTKESDGSLHSRPMHSEAIGTDGKILFFAQAHSTKMQELEKDNQVSLGYIRRNGSSCVAISGRGKLLRDKEKIKQLWKPLYKAWFPKGLEDPELALLEVTIDGAEYWESPSKSVVKLLGAAKAILTGAPAGPTVGEHRKIELR